MRLSAVPSGTSVTHVRSVGPTIPASSCGDTPEWWRVVVVPMSKKKRLVFVSRLAFVLLACVVGCAPAAHFNLTGGWSGTFSYTSGPMTSLSSSFSMELFDDEGSITGSATFPSGAMQTFEIPITLGETHADTVVLEASGFNDKTTPQTPVRFSLDGEATATTMSGVGTHTVNGTPYTFTWQATLVAPPPPVE